MIKDALVFIGGMVFMAGLQVTQDWLRRISAIELVEEWESERKYSPSDVSTIDGTKFSDLDYIVQFEELPPEYVAKAVRSSSIFRPQEMQAELDNLITFEGKLTESHPCLHPVVRRFRGENGTLHALQCEVCSKIIWTKKNPHIIV